MSLVKKILSHSFWLLIGNSIGRLAMFIANIVTARVIDQEQFGQFMMIRNTVSMIETMVTGSIGSTVTKSVAESTVNGSNTGSTIYTLLIINVFTALFLSLLLGLGAAVITDTFFLGNSLVFNGLLIGALLLVLSIMSMSVQSMMIGLEVYKKLAYSSVFASIVSIPVLLALIYMYKFYGALIGVSLYFLIDFTFKAIQLNKSTVLVTKFDSDLIALHVKQIFKQSAPLIISIVLSSFAFWHVRTIYINQTGNFSDIAIFDAAYQWLTIIMIITGATTSVVLPKLSKEFSLNESKGAKKILITNMIINLSIATVIAFIFIVFSKEIMSLYGSGYVEGYEVLEVLALVSIVFSSSSLLNKYMLANGKSINILIATGIGIAALYSVNMYFEKSIFELAISFAVFYAVLTLMYLLLVGLNSD